MAWLSVVRRVAGDVDAVVVKWTVYWCPGVEGVQSVLAGVGGACGDMAWSVVAVEAPGVP